jgi:hypothetical protein
VSPRWIFGGATRFTTMLPNIPSRNDAIGIEINRLSVRLALLEDRDDEDPAFSRDQENLPESLDCGIDHCAAVLDSRKRTTSDSEWLRRTARVLPSGE